MEMQGFTGAWKVGIYQYKEIRDKPVHGELGIPLHGELGIPVQPHRE